MKLRLSLLLCAVVFSTGCPNKPSVNFNNKNSFVNKLNDYLKRAQFECDCLSRQHTLKDAETGECNNDDVPNGPNEAKIVRDNAIDRALPVIDGMYSDFINNIESRRAKTEFIADVVELGASAAIGISKGERAIQVIGVALTAFRGGRKSGDLNFYKQQTTPILINKMDGNRAEVLSIITLNQQKPINEYSMGKAVKNLTDYYNAGTLVRAFTQLSRDTANKTQASEDAVRIIRGEDITPSTIRTAQEADISKELLRQRRVLAKKLADARSIVVPSAAAGDTQARTDEIARIKTEKDEKLKAARLKLEEVWSEVEANEKFKPIVQEMKADPAFAGIFAALQTPGTTDEAAAKHYLDLINGLTTKIRDNSELRRELLAILRTVNQ